MRKVTAGAATAALVIVIGAAWTSLSRINRTLRQSRRDSAADGDVAFSLQPFHPETSEPFEALPAANGYVTGAGFQGKLYLAGPGGLAVYDQPTSRPRQLETGVELPPAPIVTLAQGRLRGSSRPELFAGTQGEGVLILSADPAAVFQQLRPTEAAYRDVTAVLPLPTGDLLIGTRRSGLLLYDGVKLRLFKPELSGVAVTALAGDAGDFWIGTRERGLLHWHAGQLDAIDTSAGLPDVQVESIVRTGGAVYAGTPLGVAELVNGRVARVLAKGIFAQSLALDGRNLAVATVDEGVYEIALESHGPVRGSPEAEAMNAAQLFSVGQSLLAVGAGGLTKRGANGGWETVIPSSTATLTDRNVAALSFDHDGRLWVGYFDRGLDVLDLASNHADHLEDDHLFCINRIVNDPQRQTVNVATANGLVLLGATGTPRVRQVLSRRDGLISDQVEDVAFTKSGMTVATPAGLTFFTASGAESLYGFQGLVNNHVYALSAEPEDDRVFAGTLGGISILSNRTVRQNVTLRNSALKRNWITAIVHVQEQGQPESWFVGTYGGGVTQMDAAGHVTPISNIKPDAVINPNAMLRTSQHVFAGTLDDGLLVYNLATRRWSQVTDGLPSRDVTAFAERDGELYIGTTNGIVRVAEERLP